MNTGQALHDAVLDGGISCAEAVKLFSFNVIASCLAYYEGNVAATAKALGVKRSSLSFMIQSRMDLKHVLSNTKRTLRIKKKRAFCPECRGVLTEFGCFGCPIIQMGIDSIVSSLPANSKP
jgi:hypothetical protein